MGPATDSTVPGGISLVASDDRLQPCRAVRRSRSTRGSTGSLSGRGCSSTTPPARPAVVTVTAVTTGPQSLGGLTDTVTVAHRLARPSRCQPTAARSRSTSSSAGRHPVLGLRLPGAARRRLAVPPRQAARRRHDRGRADRSPLGIPARRDGCRPADIAPGRTCWSGTPPPTGAGHGRRRWRSCGSTVEVAADRRRCHHARLELGFDAGLGQPLRGRCSARRCLRASR